MPRHPKKPTDELVVQMDELAKELMTLARKPAKEGEEPSLQSQLDVFKGIAGWVAIKNRIAAPEGDDLDDLKQRLKSAPRGGAARNPTGRGRNSFEASAAALAGRFSPGNGGPALEAVKRALPRANAGDDDGAGDDSEC
jgi:hypothetical protein